MVTWIPPMTPNGIIRSYRVQYNEIDALDDNFDTTDNMTTSLIIGMLEKFTSIMFCHVLIQVSQDGFMLRLICMSLDCDLPIQLLLKSLSSVDNDRLVDHFTMH